MTSLQTSRHRRIAAGPPDWTALAVVAFLLAGAAAKGDAPLYEQEPYDEITLDAANDHAVVKVKPIESMNRREPPRRKTVGKLVIRRMADPEKQYEVAWRAIIKIEFFEQLVLTAADELTSEGRFDEAYDHYAFLERNRPDTPGLNEAFEDFLYEEAKDSQRKRHYDSALALLRELYRRNPSRPGLDRALGLATDSLVATYVESGDYRSARMLLDNLAAAYPGHPVATQWNDRLSERAANLLAEARAAAEAGRWDTAADMSRQAASIAPHLSGAAELAQTAARNYPRIVVGVGELAARPASERFDDWADRRSARLLYRTLVEFAGTGDEGGKYVCPVGTVSVEDLGRRWKIRLKPGLRWADGDAVLTSVDVSRRLLAMANPRDAAFRSQWSEVVAAVATPGVYDVEVELRRSCLQPQAMLRVTLAPLARTVAGQEPPPNGPFVLTSRSADEARFVANGRNFATESGSPKEVVERRYETVAQAVAALKRGEIQVLDRVNPWLLPSLRADGHLRVEPYALPLVHCLVPNLRRPLVADPAFRRALAYGIPRQAILDQMLGGAEIPGCVVTSSPFPVGSGANDPIRYASDESIEPRPYEPRLAIALSGMAFRNHLAARKEKTSGKSMPTLVLAFPNDEIARAACASIQKQWRRLGIPVALRPLDKAPPTAMPNDVDLLYAELAMWEPVIDAGRLFGERGLAGGCGPYMNLALRQLDDAADWRAARDCLRRIHRIAHDDALVIPLWQLVDYFAYREGLRGVAARPVTLYQNIEQWRPAIPTPAGQ